MKRRILLAVLLCFVATLVASKGPARPPVAFASPPLCIDPAHTSAVSLWSYTASNGSNGQFTAIQSDIGDSSAAGVALSASLDTIAINNVLNTNFFGQLMVLGNSIFIIAKGVDGTFMIAFIDKTASTQFKIFTIGGPTFFSVINATFVACYDNLIANPSFEVSTPVTPQLASWSATGGGATWLRTINNVPQDRFTGQGAVQTQETQSPCGFASDSYWSSSDLITINPGSKYVVGAYQRSTGSVATGQLELELFLPVIPIPIGVSPPVATRSSTTWGFMDGMVIPSDSGAGFVKLRVATTFSCSSPTTATSNFDDVFLINVGNGPAPALVH